MTTMTTMLVTALCFTSGCMLSTHASRPSPLGVARAQSVMEDRLDRPGVVELETVTSVDWEVPRSGLLNLDAPRAKAAHLVDGPEPIKVFFHVLRHPQHGMFIVDSGMENKLRDEPAKAAVRGIVAKYMHREKMVFHATLGDWLAAHPEPLRGVFLTHMHLDHVSGLPDAPPSTAIYVGPNETRSRDSLNGFVAPNIDRALAGKGPVNEWPYSVGSAGLPDGVVDIFGDGSVWAIATPGHTRGATAYLVQTPRGPVLLTGDSCHTRWGWDHDVEPGTFNTDTPGSKVSLAKLRALVARHPGIEVRLGHQ